MKNHCTRGILRKGIFVIVSSDILVAVSGQGMELSTHTLAVFRALSGNQEGKGKGGQRGREMGKYIQNITARDLIFQVKMNRKTFGGRAPPEPAGGAYALPRPRKRKRRRQGGREIGKYNQNITARDLIFQVKMNRKTFGGRAPP